MKGFVVDSTSEVREGQTHVCLFGKLENGQSFITTHSMNPYFFVEEAKITKLKTALANYAIEPHKGKTFEGKEVVKISFATQEALTKLATFFHKKEIDTYEADIKPPMRFLMDNDILGTVDIEGEYESNERVDRLYREPVIKSAQFTPSLTSVAIDLESDKKFDKLFCIGIYSSKYKHVFIVTDKKLTNATACATEKECLEKFKQKMIELDPDVITGWNIADFDFVYLRKLFDKYDVPFDIGRDSSEIKMRISADFFKKSTITVTGRQVLDGLNMIKDPFIKEAPSIKNIDIESWSLEDVSQAILEEGKTIKGKNRHNEIEDLYYKKGQQELVEYNLQDCKLAYDILEKTKTIELAVERSQLTGMPLDRITSSIASFDSLYIREARKRGLVSPTTRYTEKEERIKGGYVRESDPGIYHDVMVLDFKSLYPSIIRTFNIDPASFLKTKEKGAIESPNEAYFKNTEGILPSLIEKLHHARERAKKDKRELASYAIKIIMNSFFGVLANSNCRYFSLEVANAITHFAQFIIKLTAEKIEEKGYRVIYSDTDSIFVETKLKAEEVAAVGKELEDYINTFYEKYVKDKYDRKSYLELQFTKHYLAFMMPTMRNSERGSKKRYAGLLNKNGKEELEIVGLEAIRGDWTDAARDFQKMLLFKVFKREEFIPFVKSYVKSIKEGKLDSKLVYQKSLRKPLDEYTKTTPPHVKAARKLDKLESSVVNYYMTEDGPEPIEKVTHPIDYDHYIEKQIKPIADTVLHFFKKDFEEIIKESKQTKLFS